MVLQSKSEPMTPSQIVEIGSLNRLFEGNGRSISASVNTALHGEARKEGCRVVQLGDGRYALAEWGYPPAPVRTRRPRGSRHSRSPTQQGDEVAQRATARLREIRSYLNGMGGLSPERVCLFIEFCYLMEMHQEAVDLFHRLPPEGVDEQWRARVERLVRVCRQRLGQ
jgi:hypothetical protein